MTGFGTISKKSKKLWVGGAGKSCEDRCGGFAIAHGLSVMIERCKCAYVFV